MKSILCLFWVMPSFINSGLPELRAKFSLLLRLFDDKSTRSGASFTSALLLLVYTTSCTSSKGNLINLCTNATTQQVHSDTSETKAVRLMGEINKKDELSFKEFTFDSEQFIKYKNLMLKKKVYASDSMEICFLQRVDPTEVNAKSPPQAVICFNEKIDSLNSFNNYSQLLVKFPQSRFVSIGSDEFTEYDVITVAKTGKYTIIGSYIKGSSGVSAAYLHIYILEEREDRHLVLHKRIYWKIQDIRWLN